MKPRGNLGNGVTTMNSNFNHKGFAAQIEYSSEDNCFVGRVLDIEGLVMFSGDSVAELKSEFVTAVDEYIASREAAGLPPEKACSGTFNVRVGPELHRAAQNAARRQKMSLNEYVKQALQASVSASSRPRPLDWFADFRVDESLSVASKKESWNILGAPVKQRLRPGGKEWMQ